MSQTKIEASCKVEEVDKDKYYDIFYYDIFGELHYWLNYIETLKKLNIIKSE